MDKPNGASRRDFLKGLVSAAAVGVLAPSLPSAPAMAITKVARTYYISSTGSNANDGLSPAKAWQTIAKPNSMTFAPGSRILFAAGQTFSGSLRVVGTASESSPITVGSYGIGRATIKVRGLGYGIGRFNSGGLVIDNINIVGPGTNIGAGTHANSGIYCLNNQNGGTKLDYIRISRVDVSGFASAGVKLEGANGLSGFKRVWIEDVVAHDNFAYGIHVIGQWKDLIGYSHWGVIIRRCEAYNNVGVPNSTQFLGSGILVEETYGFLIERCHAHHNGGLNNSAGGPYGIWAFESSDGLIQSCESDHNRSGSGSDGGGFDLDAGVRNTTIQYCYSHDNDGPAWNLYQPAGGREWTGNVVRFNVSENDGRNNKYPCVLYLTNSDTESVFGVDVYQNTIIMDVAGAAKTPWGLVLSFSGAPGQIRLNNNLLSIKQTATSKVPFVWMPNDGAVVEGFSFRGNNYWAAGTWCTMWRGQPHYSLAAWRSTSGQEVGSGLAVDPLFMGDRDYRFQAASPMLGTGLDLSALSPGTRDFYGAAYPQFAKPNIGA